MEPFGRARFRLLISTSSRWNQGCFSGWRRSGSGEFWKKPRPTRNYLFNSSPLRNRLRLHLLQLFLDSLGFNLDHAAITEKLDVDARKRLEVYLQTLPEWGLVDVKFSELA